MWLARFWTMYRANPFEMPNWLLQRLQRALPAMEEREKAKQLRLMRIAMWSKQGDVSNLLNNLDARSQPIVLVDESEKEPARVNPRFAEWFQREGIAVVLVENELDV